MPGSVSATGQPHAGLRFGPLSIDGIMGTSNAHERQCPLRQGPTMCPLGCRFGPLSIDGIMGTSNAHERQWPFKTGSYRVPTGCEALDLISNSPGAVCTVAGQHQR